MAGLPTLSPRRCSPTVQVFLGGWIDVSCSQDLLASEEQRKTMLAVVGDDRLQQELEVWPIPRLAVLLLPSTSRSSGGVLCACDK